MNRIADFSFRFRSGLVRLSSSGRSFRASFGLVCILGCVLVLLPNLGMGQSLNQVESTVTLTTIDGQTININTISEQG